MMTWLPQADQSWKLQILAWQDVETERANCKTWAISKQVWATESRGPDAWRALLIDEAANCESPRRTSLACSRREPAVRYCRDERV